MTIKKKRPYFLIYIEFWLRRIYPTGGLMWWIKKLIYRLGIRPCTCSMFYSPSLAYIHMGKDAIKAMNKGMRM